MEEKINIAEILKDKSEGTKLWTDMFGSVTLYVVTDACDAFQVKHHNKEPWFDKDGKLCKEGVLCIYPSKSMRSWHKFAWKKGDVLVGVGQRIIFEEFIDENYTRFQGKYSLSTYEDRTLVADKRCYTSDFRKLDDNVNVKNYFKEIEEKLGGKLNRETLEVEKAQPEFKDGDILLYKSEKFTYFSSIFILDTNRNEMCSYVRFSIGKGSIDYDVPVYNLGTDRFRYATDSEKQQLFSALAKENKAWDSEKKAIVDLKPKYKFKPFDKVLGRNEKGDVWEAELFSHYREESQYPFRCIGFSRKYCIPYNEETAHLLGTTDDWEGGEG